MLFDLLVLFFAIVITIILGLIIFVRNTKSAESKSFLIFTISLSLWILTNFLTDNTSSLLGTLIYAKIVYFAGILIVSSIYLLLSNFGNVGKINKKSLWTYILINITAGLYAISDLAIASISKEGNIVTINPGKMYFLYPIIMLAIFSYSLIILWHKKKKTNNKNLKLQISFVFYALLISFPLSLFTNAVLPFLTQDWWITKIGPLSTVFLVSLIFYAIIRHKLFDIRAVVARSVAFILSIALVGLIYGFVSFRLVAPFVQNISQGSRYAIFTILAVIIAFTFAPLRRLFEKLTDKIFYRDKYDPQELISEIGHILSSEIRLDTLDRKVTAELTNKMKVSRAYIVVLDKGKIYYQRGGGEFDIKDLMHLGKPLIIADDLATESERKKIFDKYNIGISTVLKTKEDLVGFLLVGGKKSGDIFSTQDTRVIRIISNELAVAIQNAKAYEQIRRFNETLKTKIAEATKQLASANEHLKELDKAKDEFISMASHQLRTPLTTVKGYLSMLDEGDFGKLNKEQRDSIKLAFDGADRMAGLIGDLLNISRMEAGRFFIDAHPVDLNAIVKNEVDQLQFRANSMGVKLSLKVGKIVPQISLDEDKTRQVIMNLVDNAIHYSPKGEVRVEFGLEGDEVILKVIDNGIGVSEKDKKSLFSKFFRAGNAQKTRPDGTGLGLFLVKRVVEDQGGEIIFESEVGKGSTFGFRFPIKAKP